ncbi:Cell differentiation protein RCD1 -like protein, partial [Capsicum annuum]
KRGLFHDLAPLLCNSFGTSTVFLQEIISIYPFLSPPNLTPAQSNRVCTVLALLQCVASHPDTRMSLLNASIPSYLYAFLVTTSKSRPFEYLRLASLGVIGALVKAGDTEVIRELLSPEITPSCLRSMDIGCELSKTVATFILQKILLDDAGLDYICTRASSLGFLISVRLKAMCMAYGRSCDALGSCLPDMLRDTTFSSCLREDPVTRIWLQELLQKVDGNLDALQAGGSVSRIHSTRI